MALKDSYILVNSLVFGLVLISPGVCLKNRLNDLFSGLLSVLGNLPTKTGMICDVCLN